MTSSSRTHPGPPLIADDDIMRPRRELTGSGLYAALIFVGCLGLLASRRWQQLVSPQIWNEDGTHILPALMQAPWTEVFTPINGYLAVSSKAISALSLALSLSQYPFVGTVLSWIFVALVGVAIATSPTALRGKAACALAVFLIPSDPEVFGLPLYSFWWAALLLLLVALWDERASGHWRLAFLLLGGLSSPVVVMVLPVLYLRAYLLRSGGERTIALVATGLAAAQVVFVVQGSAGTSPPFLSVATNVVPKLLGTFLVGNWTADPALLWVAGGALAGIVAAWVLFDRARLPSAILAYLLAGSIALTVARNDPAVIDPVIAGPRYFFLPYICLSWILIQIFCTSRSLAARGTVACLGLLAAFNSYPAWSRPHDDLEWDAHIRSCRLFPAYSLPVQYDGRRSMAGRVRLSGALCAEHLRRDLLVDRAALERLPTFPYSVLDRSAAASGSQVRLEGGTIGGTDFYRSTLPGLRVVGSYKDSDADTGHLILRMRRGDRLAYRSGPRGENQRLGIVGAEAAFLTALPTAMEWIVLDFSNARLPAEFLATIRDDGAGWGEWFAVGVAN